MINIDDATKENIKEHNPNWPQIPDHPYKILLIGGSRFGKMNSLINLINYQPDIHEIYLCTEDPYPYEAKYQILINKQESTGLKHFNDFKAFIEYSNNMDVNYKNIGEYNANRKCKILIIFDNLIC